MGVLKWAGLIAAGWFAASVVVGGLWALAANRLRKPRPVQPDNVHRIDRSEGFVGDEYEIGGDL